MELTIFNCQLHPVSSYLVSACNLFAGWIQPVKDTDYPLLPDEPVQFITTDNELQKDIGVYYTLLGEGSTDEKVFCMRCENIDTNQWSYCIDGCTVDSFNTRYLDSVPRRGICLSRWCGNRDICNFPRQIAKSAFFREEPRNRQFSATNRDIISFPRQIAKFHASVSLNFDRWICSRGI